ncbi:MAG: TIGR02270 family protein [Planctomycetes bacterium]|nr:TIGR02270 family protein [Planctomycetota bacterium]
MDEIRSIVEQHASEAAFLWTMRNRLLRAPHTSLRTLADHDERLEAHVDGLRGAGEIGWNLTWEMVEAGEPGAVFAAAVLVFETGAEARLGGLLAKVDEGTVHGSALVSALGWIDEAIARKRIDALLAHASPLNRRIGIAAAAVRRIDPGRPLLDAARDPDPELRSRALHAIAELGLLPHAPLLFQNLKAQDPRVRFAAAWGTVLLAKEPNGVATLKEIAGRPGPRRFEAADLSARVLGIGAAGWREALAGNAEAERAAVAVAGAAGDPAAVPWILDQMKISAVARAAGEAFEAITGADLSADGLAGNPPEGHEEEPNDNPADENVAPDPDADLTWPDPAKVEEAWKARSSGLPPGKRCLLGREISRERCREILVGGRQRMRSAAAMELALLQPGQPLFEVRAPAWLQMRSLA